MHGHGPTPNASIVASYCQPQYHGIVVGRVGSALSPSSPSQSLLAHGINKEGTINTLISQVFEKKYFLMTAMADIFGISSVANSTVSTSSVPSK